MYKKITFISCLLAVCTALPLTAANTGDDVKPAKTEKPAKPAKAPKAPKVKKTPAAKPANTKEQTPAQPKDKRIVCDKSSVFQVSKQEKDGKEDWFFTLPDSLLGRLFQCVTRFTRTPAGFSQFGGEEVREQTVYFELSPDKKNLFLRSSVIYSKADTLDAISQAVSNSTIDPIIQSFKLESGAPKNQYKINVSNLIMGENNFALPNMYRSAMGVGGPMGNGASYIESIHSYPINVEIRSIRTYSAGNQRLPAAETGSITLGLNTSMVLLPKEPMRARIFDPRVGYFTDGYRVFSDYQQKMEIKQFITRWRLEPKDSADIEKMKRGELVEPKKQIVYYIDPATPKQWRPYLIAGINDWNAAFEQAGFKNAIVGKEWPENDSTMSLEDARFAVIRYLASPIANAYGPQVHDPRSGEIIESHVGWYHNVMTLVHDWYMIQCSNVDPKARFAKYDDELMGQLIRFVSSHELGHTLGLRHNFGSSSTVPVEKLRDKAWVAAHGHTPSIMDYARFNYVAQPEDGMTEHELFPRINDYDKWAIQWGYSPCFQATDSESDRFFMSQLITDSLEKNRRLWWGDGESYFDDPRRQTEDLSEDAVKASEYGIKNLKAELPHMQEWNYWGNDQRDNNLNTIYNQVLNQLNRYCNHVARYVSGTYYEVKSPDQPGGTLKQTPREKEKAVLPFFDRNIFNNLEWLIQVPFIDRIESTPEVILERFGRRMVGVLTGKLDDLNPNYPISEYLPELTGMIFKELQSGKAVTSYRRCLQRKLVDDLTGTFSSDKAGKGSDKLAFVLLTLKDLQKKTKAASATAADAMTRAHYTQLADQIERALNPNASTSNVSAQSINLNIHMIDNGPCYPETIDFLK